MSILQTTRVELKANKLENMFGDGQPDVLHHESVFKKHLIEYAGGTLFALESVVAMLKTYCISNYNYTAYIVKSLGKEMNTHDVDVKFAYQNAIIIEALMEHNVTVMDVANGQSAVDEVMDAVYDGLEDKDLDVDQTIIDMLIRRGWNDEQVTAEERAENRKQQAARDAEEGKNTIEPIEGSLEAFQNISDDADAIVKASKARKLEEDAQTSEEEFDEIFGTGYGESAVVIVNEPQLLLESDVLRRANLVKMYGEDSKRVAEFDGVAYDDK